MSEMTLDEDNLYFIEAMDHQVIFHYLAYDETKPMAINDLQEAAQASRCFVRIHRSFIINMRYIYDFDTSHIRLLDNRPEHLLNIGRSYQRLFRKRYMDYLFSGSV